ncbi:MAG TPA: tetratricopeptide repeat protein [Rubrobacter sp.]|nr:tetratricopeptide repeat protein [Rubrobacter sp.]
MSAVERFRYRWGLVAALSAFVAVMVVALMTGGDERPREEPARLPVDFRPAAGTATGELIGTLQRKVRENPEDVEAHVNLANAYLQMVRETGDPSLYTKADDLLDRAGKIEAQNSELLATRATLDLARHDFAAALERGMQALALDPQNARYYGIVGDAQIELGMYDDAIDSYQEMVNHRPDFASFSRVSHARELYGDPEGAIEAMEFALHAGSGAAENTAWAQAQLGNLWFNSGNFEEAARHYELSAETLDGYAPALAGQAKVAAANGELDQAARLYEQAFNRMPLPESAIALGDVYAEMGNRRKAEQQYRLIQGIDKLYRANGVNTDLEIALFYADHDLDLQTSLEKARSAYDARPGIHAADAMAWTLYKTGDFQEAQRYASEALELGTRDPLKLFHAGMIARALGQDERAKEYLQQATDLNPHFSLLYEETASSALKDLEKEQSATPKGGE